MKRIKIDHIVEPHPEPFYVRDSFFWVYLGNKTKHKFTSKRNALAFLANVNRFLNNKLHEANYLYCEVFTQYRENWFYFWHDKKTFSNKFQDKLRSIERRISVQNETFELLVNRAHLPNGNYFVWTHFNTIFDAQAEICEVLVELQKSRSNGAEAQRLRILLDRINITRNQLNSYLVSTDLKNDMDKTGRVIPMPIPIDEIAISSSS